MRVTTSDTITEPAMIIDRPTDALLVLSSREVTREFVLYLDKLLSAY